MSARTTTPIEAGSLQAPAFDIQKYLALFRKHLMAMAVVGGLVFTAVAFLLLSHPPEYTASAQLLLDTRRDTSLDLKQQAPNYAPPDANAVDTEVEVLRSRAVADAAVTRLGLDQTAGRRHRRIGPLDQLGQLLGLSKPTAVSRPGASPHERAVDELTHELKVTRVGLTSVMDVAVTADDPVEAARRANAVAQIYLERQLKGKADVNIHAGEELSSKLEPLRKRAEAADQAVQAYKASHGLATLGGTSSTEQDIANLTAQSAAARAAQAEADARLNTSRAQLARGSNGEALGESLSSPVIQQLRSQRAQLSAQAIDLQGRYGPRHPEVIKVEGQLKDLDQQIQAEVSRIQANLETQAQVARQRSASIEGSLGAARGQLTTSSNAMAGLAQLVREQDTARTLYQSVLDKTSQTNAEQGIEQNDARVISAAKPPTKPSAPNVPKGVAVSLALGFVAALGTLFAGEALQSGFSTAEDVEQGLGVASLPSIPLLASTLRLRRPPPPVDFVVSKPLSAFTESFRTLKTAITAAGPGGREAKVIMLTSALPGEGKTTTTICLARTIALAGTRVVMVDCDLRRRSIARYLQATIDNGLLEVMDGKCTLDEALVHDATAGACILPLSRQVAAHRDAFSIPAFDDLLAELRRRFDVVLLDAPPVLPVADARVLAGKADATALLVRWRRTPRRAAEAALRELEAVGAGIAGVSLTQVDVVAQARAGYGDTGYYYRAYSTYYTE